MVDEEVLKNLLQANFKPLLEATAKHHKMTNKDQESPGVACDLKLAITNQ